MAGRSTGSKRRKQRNRFKTVVILFCVNLVLAVALVCGFIYVSNQKSQAFSWLALQEITVSGNTKYDQNAIIGESGLSVGQSVFSVNKATASKNIKNAFPYVADAVVSSPSYNSISIHIVENKAIGAMYADGKWLVVGENGNILEQLSVESDRPGRYFYFKGATPAGDITPGKPAMDERSFGIVTTVMQAIEENGIEGVVEINLQDKTNISFNWKNLVTVTLGNETNLKAEIRLFSKVLPHILERNGGSIAGRVDLSSYSDNTDSNDKIIYTPKDVLEKP